MSQRCYCQRCNVTIRTIAVTALCSLSLSQRCAHRYLTAVGFLLCTLLTTLLPLTRTKLVLPSNRLLSNLVIKIQTKFFLHPGHFSINVLSIPQIFLRSPCRLELLGVNMCKLIGFKQEFLFSRSCCLVSAREHHIFPDQD